MASINPGNVRANVETLITNLTLSNARDLLCLLTTLFIAYRLSLSIYRIWFHPLSKFPGPPLLSAFRFPYLYNSLVKGAWVRRVPALHQKYGNIVRIGPNHLAVDGIVAWPEVYAHRSGGRVEFSRPQGIFFPGDHLSILGAAREDHRRMRRQLAPAFSDGTLNEQEPTITQYVELLLNRLEEHGRGGAEVNIVEWLNFAMFDIVGELAFSDSFHSLKNNAYHPWVRSIFVGVRGIEMGRFFKSYPLLGMFKDILSMTLIKAFDDSQMAAAEKTMARMGEGVESKTGRRDFMTFMMQKTRAGEPGMSQHEILATTPIIIMAGSETAGTVLSGLFFYLARNRFAYDALTYEVRSAFSSEKEITFRSAANLEYLNACIDEALRVYPPAAEMTPRVSPGDVVAGEYIPKGTLISVYPWATFRNPTHFADANTFSPQRWLSPSHALYEDKFKGDNRSAFKPFSVGSRDCIGKNLAYAEMRLLTARLVYRFEYELVEGQERWHDRQRTYLGWEKGPLYVRLERRLDVA